MTFTNFTTDTLEGLFYRYAPIIRYQPLRLAPANNRMRRPIFRKKLRPRSDIRRHSLGSFCEQLDRFDGLLNLIENAKVAIGISTYGKAFSNNLLRVEVSGPNRLYLTIVDLPGELRSVILAVVSIVLRLARDTDLSGNRILGVISKPDTLVPGSESKASFMSLTKNQEVAFRLRWYVLINTDSEKGQ
ncbi:hypothetical protein N7449_004407 [Penicillium cf. viridicatum]|uniref:Uncharacterized protein n=1 Tax=Penicillium cf. viridicatum TaxID=2972119 RepID=A0A9W9MJ66_9EURO|nr:hypothetical protein N7449_004407 [Penicillium cf. viridicatum]